MVDDKAFNEHTVAILLVVEISVIYEKCSGNRIHFNFTAYESHTIDISVREM